MPIVRRRLLSRHALQLGSLTISAVGASFSSFVVAKPPRQTCFLRPRGPPRAPGNSPPHTVVASQQLRLSHRFHPEPSPLRRSSGSPPPYSTTSRDSRPICCGSGHSPASLVACRSDASWHLHSVPPSVPKHAPCVNTPYALHVIWWLLCPRCRLVVDQRVQHPALFVSYASRDGQHVPRCAAAAAVFAQSRAGQSPSNAAYEEFPHFLGPGPRQSARAYEEIPLLTSSASAPKQTTLPVDLLVHRDAASC